MKLLHKLILVSFLSRQTILLEIDSLGEPQLTYLPGDHVAIYPGNRECIVEAILKRVTDISPDDIVTMETVKEKATAFGK